MPASSAVERLLDMQEVNSSTLLWATKRESSLYASLPRGTRTQLGGEKRSLVSQYPTAFTCRLSQVV